MRPYGEDRMLWRFNVPNLPRYDKRRYEHTGKPGSDGWEMRKAKQARRDFKIIKLCQRKRARRWSQLEIERALYEED